MPSIQTKYSDYFGVKKGLENISINKIKLISDKRFAEFNYELLNNILSI